MSFFAAFSQTNLTVGAPANTNGNSALRAPNGTTAHTTLRAHIIITAAEMASIPSGTVISGLGFLYNTGANIPASGNIQFYLENTSDATNLKSSTWATAISTMTSVYSGAYTIPDLTLQTNVATTTPFTYTGGGLYVAYDYLGSTFATTAATYLCEYLAVPGGTVVGTSATTTPPAVLTATSAYRPEIQFTFTNPFNNNLAVSGIFPHKGKNNLLLGSTQNVDALITNLSSVAITNVPVSLSITGANAYTTSQTIASIAPGADVLVNFAAVPNANTGSQTVLVSIPPDQQTFNDSYSLTQEIFCDTVGYSFGNSITGGLGYNTGTGILANLLVVPAGGPVFINKVVPVLSDAVALTGNTIKGVLLNSAGVIIDSTASFTIAASNLGLPVELTYINGGIDVAGDSVYYGFRQVANTVTGYFPLATQDISGYVPVDLFCGFGAFGGAYANYTDFGVFMISAVLNTVDLTSNAVNGGICQGSALNVSSAVGSTNYDFSVNGISAQSGASNTYSFTPSVTSLVKVQSTSGSCVYADSVSFTPIAPVTSSVTDGLCPNSTYNFHGQSITTAGTYTATIPSSLGCDSTITLTLNNISTVFNTVAASICQGQTYLFGGQSLAAGGVYMDTLLSSAGCDSVVTLNLTLNLPSTSTLTVDICAPNYLFGTQSLATSGTYTRTIPNAVGCDSVITLNLTINPPVTVSVTKTGAVLTATVFPPVASYQWVECPAYSAIPGATNSTFQPNTPVGNFAVIATGAGGCADTSACFLVDQLDLDELSLSATIQLYPNPSDKVVHAVSSSYDIVAYKVIDMNGRVVLENNLIDGASSIEFSIEEFESGKYNLELTTVSAKIIKPFIKK